jgi:mRNA-degrading endonuclease toxin of MazEF toxin-antitoxin module
MLTVEYGGIYLYEPPNTSKSEQSALLVTSGSEQAGLRPYIIVSRDMVNRGKRTAVGVSMSTRIHKANSYRTLLPDSEIIREVGCTFQFQDSVVLCDHIRVLDLDQIRYKIGRVSDTAMAGTVLLGLSYVFGIR